MPELPEVEFAARRLHDAAVGRTIASASALHPAQRRAFPDSEASALAGATVMAVVRRAKLQLVALDDGRVLEVHFRMNGDWEMARASDPAPAHERVRFTFTDGSRVSLTDSRALCVVRVHDGDTFEEPDLGPEPLDETWTAESLRSALTKRRGPIKPALLDQRVVAGLGNIYAAESLWEARIDPRVAANTLSGPRVAALRNAIQAVLRRAPAGRYYAAEGASNSGDEGWRVYGREGEPCPRCGAPIKRIVQAARSTFFCASCQRK